MAGIGWAGISGPLIGEGGHGYMPTGLFVRSRDFDCRDGAGAWHGGGDAECGGFSGDGGGDFESLGCALISGVDIWFLAVLYNA